MDGAKLGWGGGAEHLIKHHSAAEWGSGGPRAAPSPPAQLPLVPGGGGPGGWSHASAPPLNGAALHFPFLFQTSASCFVSRRNPLAKKGMKTTDLMMKNVFSPNQ